MTTPTTPPRRGRPPAGAEPRLAHLRARTTLAGQAAVTAALRPGETESDFLRDAARREVARRSR